MFCEVLSKAIRWYLRQVPVTEGKKQLLSLAMPLIVPMKNNQVTMMKHGFIMRLNLANKEHLHMWLYGTHDERYEISMVEKLVREGDICWDIGANIGFYTLFLSKLAGPSGRVFSIEPAERTFQHLVENISLNNVNNVKTLKLGIGDSDKEAVLYCNNPEFGEGTASLKFQDGNSSEESVTIASIDNLITKEVMSKPDFIKIDVEGFQCEVFKGGVNYFTQYAPLILAELKEKDREEMVIAEKLIRDMGFDIFEIYKNGLKPCLDITKSKKRNFILAKPGSANYKKLSGHLL